MGGLDSSINSLQHAHMIQCASEVCAVRGVDLRSSAELTQVPTQDVQDKVSFIINNLSQANYESKARELADLLPEHFSIWFAQYVVMKR